MVLCPQLQQTGTCEKANCTFSHDITLFCFDCNILCPNVNHMSLHLRGARHQITLRNKQRTADVTTDTYCDICVAKIPVGCEAWRVHSESVRHRKNLVQNPKPDLKVPDGFYEYCHVCNRCLTDDSAYQAHQGSSKHQTRVRMLGVAATLKQAQADKHNITVTPNGAVDFGFIVTQSLGAIPSFSALLKITASAVDMQLLAVRFLSSRTEDDVHGVFSTRSVIPLALKLNNPVPVDVIFQPGAYRGYFSNTLELLFMNTVQRQPFTISRSVSAIVGAEEDYNRLRLTAPYAHRPKPGIPNVKKPIPGPIPAQELTIPYIYRLPDYPLDESLLTVGSQKQRIASTRNMLPKLLNRETYKQYWSTLLHIEEGHMKTDIEAYDLENVPLNLHDKFYYLDVPGLAENRPSVVVGDSVYIRLRRNPQHWFEGRVHVVRESEVGMKFHISFNYQPQDLCDVRFTINRVAIQRKHYALDKPFFPDRVLFPTSLHITGLSRPSARDMARIRLFNPLIRANPPQLEAVTAIVERPSGSTPFIVFGPPGTGKTTTVAEAILQILERDPSARILACAPSNSAADLIAGRLTDLGPNQLFRLYAPPRSSNLLPDNLRQFSYQDDQGHLSIRSKEDLESYRVVVSTCISASIPESIGMEAGHFSHIFIDEAGQAMEPEIMIPIKTMADPATNIILSGDPQQLDPIIRSDVANALGLGTSYLSRLIERDVYDYRIHSGITIAKLVKNWRSHEAILRFPNNAFYNGELEVCGHPETVSSHLDSPVLARPGFPIVFHGVSGSDDREANSPSYFNIDEISLVYQYVDELRTDRRRRLNDNDIGIISPYNAQGKKLRKRLKAQYEDIKVGTVEEFQGQERRVILISTVRSSRDNVNHDLKHVLGFLVNPRRLNVAITCAQALLIIVGNPHILGLDPLWRQFLDYTHQNGGWKGLKPNWNVGDDSFGAGFCGAGPSTQVGASQAGWTAMEALAQNIREVVAEGIRGGEGGEEDYCAESLGATQERPFERDE